jgi:predicted phage-related endonuclease
MLRHRTRPWMTASLDARVLGERRIVECKWTHARRWSSVDEPVPGDVQAQVQHAMEVAGADVADVVALVGPTLRIVEVPRDPAFIAALISLETDFWAHVESGTPPEPDGSDSARQTLGRLHPVDDGTYLPATPDLVELVEMYRAAKATVKSAEDSEKGIGNALRAVIAEASGIEGLVTLRKSADSTRTNWPAVASGYRVLLNGHDADELDAIVSIHSETRQGPRPLLLSKEKA